ncbi:uncharacterized protein N7518_009283 [Penicillium psychrosexuale]|uniref:uncharacterized protein n=1 Tax=Penicillium psychrosexuale TaxID=1002107 RepID=UPI0025457DEE|nr:uncharacterized protein N7518_009283 [Penicillium psychrosexuale]KAJ5783606.1 hypothetical protein N7518_009283 [Penicillium psychrosexuale]
MDLQTVSVAYAYDGNSFFVTGFNVSTGNQIRRIGTRVSTCAQQAIVEGFQYLWDKELLSQSVSILWRTEYDNATLAGVSSTALCLLCFQNFETPLCSPAALNEDHRGPPKTDVTGFRLKGGFLLPPDGVGYCGAEEETTPSPQQWVLEEKLTEDFQSITNCELELGGGPSFAVFKYLCYSAIDSSKKAFIRIYFQISNPGTEFQLPRLR